MFFIICARLVDISVIKCLSAELFTITIQSFISITSSYAKSVICLSPMYKDFLVFTS